MTAAPARWQPDPYETDAETRGDGSILLRPRRALEAGHCRMMDALEHWAQVAPDRVLVARRTTSGEWRKVTYAQMLARVQRIAEGLLDRNLSADRPIAILSGNSIEHMQLAFAATWAGIPYCPVSPSYSMASGELNKLRFVLRLLTPGLIAAFGTPAFARALTDVVDPSTELLIDANTSLDRPTTTLEKLENSPTGRLAAAHAATHPESIVKFLLTSGSTGEPKAVIATERMHCSNAMMLRQALPFLTQEPPVIVDWLPWNHTFGGSHNVGLVLFNGGSLYIDDGKPIPSSFTTTLQNLREISPTVYFNVPKGFDALAQHLSEDAQLRRMFYRRLQANFFAGASLSQHTRETLDRISMEERGIKVPMLSGIGATETGPSVTFTTPAAEHTSVIGLPAAGCLVKLTPVEGKLEIRVRSPAVSPGYWRRPDLTAAALDDEGFYRMGDAVRLLDPSEPTRGLVFDGRIAEDFKLASGTWVSVGPLRALLIAALSPLVQDVVIAGLDQDYLTAIFIPDLAACSRELGLEHDLAFADAAADLSLLDKLKSLLEQHAARYPASSMAIRRASLIPSAPSLDHGEITDKGSINQRAVLQRRADQVSSMYATKPPPGVIVIR